jgi:CheY-like chemotaxis protein
VNKKDPINSRLKNVGRFFNGRGGKQMGKGGALEKELDDLGLLEKARGIFFELGDEAAISYIRSGYRLLSKVYHPDLNQQNPEKAKILQQRLNEAQQLLNRTNDRVLLGLLRKKSGETTSKRKKILVVEDEFGLQATLKEVFQLEGYEVRVAVDGDEGYEIYRRFKPDLILTDIVMPRMSGLELVRKIRKSDRGIRVIYMSGFFGVKSLKQELDEEVSRYGYPVLPKPTKISVMLGLIKEYLGE